ncbi:MAG TPA: FAD-binding oxidoreductase, partial [Novosphingobium sp.]
GIVTAATLRLVPAVAERVVVWAGIPSLQVARQLLLACEDGLGAAVEGFEIVPAASLAAVLAHIPTARAPLAGNHAWHALIEIVADAEAAPTLRERVERTLARVFERGLAEDAVLSANEAQAAALWLLRESVPIAERAKGQAVQHDISVPVEDMPAFIDVAVPAIEAAFPGTQAVAFGHLGDGNVHFHVIAPEGTPPAWQDETGKQISAMVHDLVVQWHGSISAEHGIGQLKRAELERVGDPVALDLMRRIKAALDPQDLLNPGKLVALAPGRPND